MPPPVSAPVSNAIKAPPPLPVAAPVAAEVPVVAAAAAVTPVVEEEPEPARPEPKAKKGEAAPEPEPVTVTKRLPFFSKNTWVLMGLGVAVSVGSAIYLATSSDHDSSTNVEDDAGDMEDMEDMDLPVEPVDFDSAREPALKKKKNVPVDPPDEDDGIDETPAPVEPKPTIDAATLQALDTAYQALPKSKRMEFLTSIPREHRAALREFWKKKK